MERDLTVTQVAKIAQVSPNTVKKWFDSGMLKGYKVPNSKHRRIVRAELEKFLKQHGIL